jgi:hypothetical protein
MRGALQRELELSERIMREGEAVVPRFRVETRYGTFAVFAPVAGNRRDRIRNASLVKAFMMWKLAHWFVMSAEARGPDGIVSVLIARNHRLAIRRGIRRTPLRFSDPEWLDATSIDSKIATLLPDRCMSMSRRQYDQLMKWLGPSEMLLEGIDWRAPQRKCVAG